MQNPPANKINMPESTGFDLDIYTERLRETCTECAENAGFTAI